MYICTYIYIYIYIYIHYIKHKLMTITDIKVGWPCDRLVLPKLLKQNNCIGAPESDSARESLNP